MGSDRIRQELQARKLDWSTARETESKPVRHAAQRVVGLPVADRNSVRCIPDERFQQLEATEQLRRAEKFANHNQLRPAQIAIRRSLELQPVDAGTCNGLAWLLATGPLALRNPDQAIELAERAVAGDPRQATFSNTLGIALFRADRYLEAVAALESSLRRSKPKDQSFDLFFLAMCYARLGVPGQASESFERAMRLMEQHDAARSPEQRGDLDQFAREAELVIRPTNAPPDGS